MEKRKKNKERFLELCKGIKREGIDDLLAWLEASDFYQAPASSRFHGAYAGGLVEHSLNVYDEAKRLLTAYPEIEVDEETILISTLFHDLCKVNLYKVEKRNRKNDAGFWESYDYYGFDEKFAYGGHGSKSAFLAQHYIPLTHTEAVAINNHMGAWEDGAAKYAGAAFEQFPFAWLVSVADQSATFLKEKK